MASILATSDDLLTPEERRARQQQFLNNVPLTPAANVGPTTSTSRAFDSAQINQVGSPFFNPNDELSAHFAESDPSSAITNALARFGSTTQIDNPFVNFVQSQIAPGLNALFQLQDPRGREGDLSGLVPFLNDVAGAFMSPGNSFGQGTLMGFDQFRETMRQLASGGIDTALINDLNNQDANISYRTFQDLIRAGTAGTTSETVRNAMLLDLRQKAQDYAQLQIASGGKAMPFGQFLFSSGYIEKWFS